MPTVITASFFPLDTRVLARSGENTVLVAKDKYDVLTNHAQTIYHNDKALLLIHINPNTRIDAALDHDRQKLSDRNKHVLGVTVWSEE